MPRHFCDGTSSKITSWDDFKAFCDKCERIYDIDGNGLVYVERIEGNGMLHFSIIRGIQIPYDVLQDIHDELLTHYRTIFGWIHRRNKGLQRIVEQCGLQRTELEMRWRESHGKVMVWDCYAKSV